MTTDRYVRIELAPGVNLYVNPADLVDVSGTVTTLVSSVVGNPIKFYDQDRTEANTDS